MTWRTALDLDRPRWHGIPPIAISAAILWSSGGLVPELGRSQVIPDATLSRPSQTSESGNTITITGGTARGSNLFHSFRQFSVPADGTAFFNSEAAIHTIVARVTGTQSSQIAGILRTSPSVNLFLINPHGILFGPTAQLDVGGSFMASTVNQLRFPDGSAFSASQPQDAPLLSIHLTPGLQYGAGRPQAAIVQQGQLISRQALALQGSRLDLRGSLQANGAITLQATDRIQMQNATIASLPQVQPQPIEITAPTISLSNSQVISQVPPGSDRSGSPIHLTGDRLDLQQRSLIGSSSAGTGPGGDITIAGQTLHLATGATIASVVQGAGRGGKIDLNLDSIQIEGGDRQWGRSGIITQVGDRGTGAGGRLHVQTDRLVVTQGGWLASLNSGQGRAGDVVIQANQAVDLQGSSTIPNEFGGVLAGGIFSYTFNQTQPAYGRGGDIQITTPSLAISQGSEIQSLTRSFGDGGDVQITSDRVMLSQAARLSSNTDLTGRAGTINILARDRFILQGTGQPEPTFERLAQAIIQGNLSFTPLAQPITLSLAELWRQQGATVELAPGDRSFISVYDLVVASQQRTGIFSAAAGPGQVGNVQIRSPQIEITDQAIIGILSSTPQLGTLHLAGDHIQITQSLLLSMPVPGVVSNTHTGSGRNSLEILADRLTLDDSYLIAAASAMTRPRNEILNAGTIQLRIGEVLDLRQGSQITARAFGQANGGNLTIEAKFIVAVLGENSDLVAKAFQGQGGTIRITTQGIFGLAYRPLLTPFSDINASSDVGLDGSLILTTPHLDPSQGLVQLSTTFVDPSHQILQTCSPQARGDRFVVIGRGGLPPSAPMEMLSLPSPWTDDRPLALPDQPPSSTNLPPIESASPEILEATTWFQAADGSIHLVANHPTDRGLVSPNCQPPPH